MSHPWYRVGTISIASESATVTGTTTGWGNPAYARPGDMLLVKGADGAMAPLGEIAAVASDTELTLVDEWLGDPIEDADYAIMPAALVRSSVAALAFDIATFTSSLPLIVSGEGAPSDEFGSDGWYYFREDAPEYYRKVAGEWVGPVDLTGPQGPAGPGVSGTSETSLTLEAGSKTLTTQAGKAWLAGTRIRCASSASPSTHYMEGTVSAYNAETGELSFGASHVVGTGTLASWNIGIAGDRGATGVTGASFGGASSSEVTIGTGSKAFTVPAGLAYTAGQRVRASSTADAANFVEGPVSSYVGTTLTINADRVGGSGTISSWNINVAGLPGGPGPGYLASSTSNRTVGTGEMTFTVQSGLAYSAGARVRVAVTSDPGNIYMEGVTVSYSGTALVVNFDRAVGSGTASAWTINLAGDRGATGASYAGTSASSLEIGEGSKVFATQTTLAYQAGARARAVSQADNDNWMEGYVTSYTGGNLTLDVDATGGEGTFADWLISLAGTPGDAAAAEAAATAAVEAKDAAVEAKDAAVDAAAAAVAAAASVALPESIEGQAGRALVVNATEDGYEFADVGGAVTLPRGYISGFVQANNGSDAVNDIDISAGSCRSDDDTDDIVLASAITKRLDGLWTVGSGNGGRDTGSIANGWWYLWAIKRTDTGVCDVLFSASATAPTLPANYDKKRRIGAVHRNSGALRAFTAYETAGGGLRVEWTAPVQDLSGGNATSSTALSVTAPPGTVAEMSATTLRSGGFSYLGVADKGGTASVSVGSPWLVISSTATDQVGGSQFFRRVNVSSQVAYIVNNSNTSANIWTHAFRFERAP